jgi:hypothetical protein
MVGAASSDELVGVEIICLLTKEGLLLEGTKAVAVVAIVTRRAVV